MEIAMASRASDAQAHCGMVRVSFSHSQLHLCLHVVFLHVQRLKRQPPAAQLGAALLSSLHPQPSRSLLFSCGTLMPKVFFSINFFRLFFGQAIICSDFRHLLGAVTISNCLWLFSASICQEKVVCSRRELRFMPNAGPFWWKIPRNYGKDETVNWD